MYIYEIFNIDMIVKKTSKNKIVIFTKYLLHFRSKLYAKNYNSLHFLNVRITKQT